MNSNRTFLIVDDDADDQELFIEAVSEVDNSIKCLVASNCEEAFLILGNESNELPHIIFLDLNLPRVNGKQCLAALKKEPRLSAIPVIIYSTSSEKKDIDETSDLGAAYFLTKPNRFEELCQAISYVVTTDWKDIT